MKKKGTATQNEDKLSRDSSVQSGAFASTHKERKKREGRNTVTRVTTVKRMKRGVAERHVTEEWNFCKCGVRPIHMHCSSAKETSL